jgi:hypothetical protein
MTPCLVCKLYAGRTALIFRLFGAIAALDRFEIRVLVNLRRLNLVEKELFKVALPFEDLRRARQP